MSTDFEVSVFFPIYGQFAAIREAGFAWFII